VLIYTHICNANEVITTVSTKTKRRHRIGRWMGWFGKNQIFNIAILGFCSIGLVVVSCSLWQPHGQLYVKVKSFICHGKYKIALRADQQNKILALFSSWRWKFSTFHCFIAFRNSDEFFSLKCTQHDSHHWNIKIYILSLE
jgi:hypothetical protein